MADDDVAKKLAAEYERYYQELVTAKTYRTVYSTYSTSPHDMSEAFARDLALHLQFKSGYICKIKKFYPSVFRSPRWYVQCKFVKTTDEFKLVASVVLSNK